MAASVGVAIFFLGEGVMIPQLHRYRGVRLLHHYPLLPIHACGEEE